MWVGLQCVIVAFSGQIHLRFDVFEAITIISHLGSTALLYLIPNDLPLYQIIFLKYFKTLFPLFVFSGEVGDWKNWFTVAQNEEFDRIMAEKMKNISHKFLYVLETSADDKDI